MEKEKLILLHKDLSEKLQKFSESYYLFDAPIVSDAEYDSLYRKLVELESSYPWLKKTESVSEKVGAGRIDSKFGKIEHIRPMLSLENAFNNTDIEAFLGRIRKLTCSDNFFEMVAEAKLDGLSASIRYVKGSLVSAATRGDGSVGEDVTENVKCIDNVPLKICTLDNSDAIEIRGEVVMLKSDFVELNKEREKNGLQKFVNPRNAAAGSLRQLDPNVTKSRKLKFFAYQIVGDSSIKMHSDSLEILRRYEFDVNPIFKICKNKEELDEFYEDVNRKRAELEFDIDGVVFKVNDLALQAKLGNTGKYPRHSIAYKFSAEQAETKILDIFVQVGRTGVITPVASVLPVNVGGVEISKATLHNKDEILRKDIRVGDTVVIQRAGDVIPQIVSVVHGSRLQSSQKYAFPVVCPSCGSALVETDDVAVKCPNVENCKAQNIEKIIHFASKNALNIEGLGDKTVEFLVENGFVKSPLDLFKFSEYYKFLLQFDGWGERQILNIKNAIEKSKKVSLDRFINSLSIPLVGKIVSKQLANFFKSSSGFITCGLENNFSSLIHIDGIGESIINECENWFSNKRNADLVVQLNDILDISNIQKVEGGKLDGMTFVFTGTLEAFTRDEAKRLVEENGGNVVSSISKKINFVVAGTSAGSKLNKAKELDLKIISEEEFRAIFQL